MSQFPASLLAMVDCNNFYASCERLADPSLTHRPVAVLSSNDGCIIARSDEVKALGIPMGAPVFRYRERLAQHKVVLRSANFDFYVDVSARIMRLLREIAPRTEGYSIDEAFLDLSGMARFHDISALAQCIRTRILEEVGIPVSVGVAPTKVLAKVANQVAKRRKTYVELLLDGPKIAETLAEYPAEKVWGIGPRTAQKLLLCGAKTAAQVAALPDAQILQLCSVVELRVVRELRGVPSIGFQTEPKPKKHIGTSRSFGQEVTTFADLREAVSYFVMFASVKLRQQHSAAGRLYLYARTNPFRKSAQPVSLEQLVRLPTPTDHTPVLMRAAQEALRAIYRPDLRYKKAGVLLLDIVPADALQGDLFTPPPSPARARVSRLADMLNQRYGKHSLSWAVYQGAEKTWMPRSEYLAKPLEMGVTEEDRHYVRPWW